MPEQTAIPQHQHQPQALDLGAARGVLAERSVATLAELQAENQRLNAENIRMAEFRRQFQERAPRLNKIVNETLPQERAAREAAVAENERLKAALEEAERAGFQPSVKPDDPVLKELRSMREEMAAIKSRNQQPSLTLNQPEPAPQPAAAQQQQPNDPAQDAMAYFDGTFQELSGRIPGLDAHRDALLNKWWQSGGHLEVTVGEYVNELSTGKQQADLALQHQQARNFPGVPGGGGSQMVQPGQVVAPGSPVMPQQQQSGVPARADGRPAGLEDVSAAHLAGQLTRLQQPAVGY